MNIGDVVTIGLILVALWTFIPSQHRATLRGGLEPTVIALAGFVRRGSKAVAYVIADLAYVVFVGQPRIVKSFDSSGADYVAQRAPRTAPEPPEPAVVRADVHQLGSGEPAKNGDVAELPRIDINARMTRAELITLLAVQKAEDGAYRYSANQITGFVGGTAADVKKLIAEIREPVAPLPAPTVERGKSLQRPAGGW